MTSKWTVIFLMSTCVYMRFSSFSLSLAAWPWPFFPIWIRFPRFRDRGLLRALDRGDQKSAAASKLCSILERYSFATNSSTGMTYLASTCKVAIPNLWRGMPIQHAIKTAMKTAIFLSCRELSNFCFCCSDCWSCCLLLRSSWLRDASI